MESRPARSSFPLLAAFFLSGVAGLVHEVAWTRVLRHVMGNTTFAVTTVLVVFMAGLAFGSYLAGRLIARRRDPVRVFALLEGAIGATCLALPFVIGALQPVYAALYRASGGSFLLLSSVRVVFCVLVLLPTATAMGATLPVLVRQLAAQSGSVGASVGRLYAINTLGAVAGAALAGFVLMPALGLWGAIGSASALNFLVCAIGLRLFARLGPLESADSRAASGAAPVDPELALDRGRRGLLLFGYGLSGAAALAYEVVWTRVLASMIGSSVYAFSMMLTAFILGLGLGSLFFARASDRVRDPLRALALLQVGIAVTALAVVPLFTGLPFWFAGLLSELSESWWQLQAREFGALVAIMLLPTTLMGATFPLVSRYWAEAHATGAARAVGATYSANTIGSIVGSALAGFLLVPTIGSQRTIYLAVLANALVAATFALADRRWRGAGRGVALAAPALALVAPFLLPRWNPVEMYFGSFFVARRDPELARAPEKLREWVREDEVLLHEEGIDTTVTVRRDPEGALALLVNGKPDAGTGGDLGTQILLGEIPLLLHPAPKRVLVIGLASGITLGSVACHPVEHIDCAEISSSVVRACRLFSDHNGNVLDDPRVEILVADGRNHLTLSGRRYDVIVSEPSNPWIAGVADLFTLQFFRTLHAALEEGGIACVWLERYAIDERSFKSVVRTFREVFPSMTVWSPNPAGSDYMLVGARGELAVDLSNLERRVADERVAADLARIGIAGATSLLGHVVMGSAGAERFSGAAPLHTDDNALLEFATPRSMMHSATQSSLVAAIEAQREVDTSFLRGELADPSWREKLARWIEARGLVARATAARVEGRAGEAQELFRQAQAAAPQDVVVQRGAEGALAKARGLAQQGQVQEALAAYQEGLEREPTHALLNLEAAQLYLQTGALDPALEHLERVVRAEPENAAALELLALLLASHPSAERRDPARALAIAEGLLETQGQHPLVLRTLSAALAANGRFEEARATAAEALEQARLSGLAALLPFLEQMEQAFARREPWRI